MPRSFRSGSIAFKITLLLVFSAVVQGVLSIGYFSTALEELSRSESGSYRRDVLDLQKNRLRDNVQLAWEVVRSYHDRATDVEALKAESFGRLRSIIEGVARQAEQVLARRGDGFSDEDAREAIRRLVLGMRFNGDNYVWVNDMNGVMLIHPVRSDLEGKNLEGLQDAAGTYLFRDMIKVCSEKGEGMVSYLWAKPGEKEPKLKISCVKLLPELGWVFGTGAWVEDIGEDMRAHALRQVASMRLPDGNYFWINDTRPYMVMHPLKPALDGKDLSAFKDAGGVALFNEMVAAVKQDGEGFVRYSWAKPGREGAFPKLSFVKLFEPWGWIIGMGVYIDDVDAAVVAQKTELARSERNVMVRLLAMGGVFVLGLVAVSLLILRAALTRPLHRLRDYFSAVAEGDLEHRMTGTFSGELAQLSQSMLRMVEALRGKIGEAESLAEQSRRESERAREAVTEAEKARGAAENARRDGMLAASESLEGIVAELAISADRLESRVREVAEGAELQNERTSRTAMAMEHLNDTVLDVARNADDAQRTTETSQQTAREGADVVRRSVEAIGRVRDVAERMRENTRALGEQAESIGRIMVVITDIADQTNLLALNAAIEAARAGDAGRGFAVVADEVRKLAEKTMAATREVGAAIESIQEGTRTNVRAVDEAGRTIDEATRLADESGQSLEHIVDDVQQTASRVAAIAGSSAEQSSASAEINQAVEDISRIASETAGGMEAAAEAVNGLVRMASELEELVGRLRR